MSAKHTRREFTALLLAHLSLTITLSTRSSAAVSGSAPAESVETNFDSELAKLANTESFVSANRRDRADRIEEANAFPQGLAVPRALKSTKKISERATSLIISSEVSGVPQYNQKFHNPTWPGGGSGVTIGVGYDLGFVSAREFHEAWSHYLVAQDFNALLGCCGLQARLAREALDRVGHIDIPWQVADRQFREEIRPRCIGETQSVLPNCDLLSPDSLGALVSLVYNRGAAGFLVPSPKDAAGRFTEMRNIRSLMDAKQFDGIPAQLLSMRRLWEAAPDGRGLVLRRELEAQLFSIGLAT